MKKWFCTFLLVIIASFMISAEEMNLFDNRSSLEQFKTLSVEEQYKSIINSFRDHMGIDKIIIWVNQMISQYNRTNIPYINDSLVNFELGSLRSKHRDFLLDIEQYILEMMVEEKILTDEDKNAFIELIHQKINEYILKYRVIDYPVGKAIDVLSVLGYSFESDDEEVLSSDTPLKVYYEKKLGITGLLYTDLNEYTILDSPLAEYITD